MQQNRGGRGIRSGQPISFGGLRGFYRNLPATAWLITANVVAYLVSVAQSRSFTDNYQHSSLFLDTALFGPDVADGQWWRIATSAFDHFGPMHIFANMWMLLILGLGTERAVGSVRYLGLFVASVLGGAGAALFMTPTSLVAGASGGIFGLMGAWAVIATFYKLKPQGLLVLIALNLLVSVVVPGISLAGHIGGLIAGALAALVMMVLPEFGLRQQPAKVRAAVCWISWALLLVALFAFGVWAAVR